MLPHPAFFRTTTGRKKLHNETIAVVVRKRSVYVESSGPGSERLPEALRGNTIVGLVRRDGPDLSARQLAALPIC